MEPGYAKHQTLSDWQFTETGKDVWLPAQVPGHVHCDLLAHGLIEDPFVLDNELKCQWVDERDWSYRCSFDWFPDGHRPNRVIRFEGLDTVCTISLNGEVVGRNDNMFVPFEIDVTKLLSAGVNELCVEFQSAAAVGRERKALYLAEQHLQEDVPNFEERAFVRKSQCMFGWDWGPRLVSCGIWKPVELIEFASRITHVDVQQSHLPNGQIELTIATAFEGAPATARHVYGDLQFLDGKISVTTTLDPSLPAWHRFSGWLSNRILVEGDDEDRAGGSLLTLTTVLAAPGDPQAEALLRGEKPSRPSTEAPERYYDDACIRIGLRSIELITADTGDGSTYEFKCDGKPLFALGANWIPDHSFPSQVNRGRYEERLQQAKHMGVNMLRVWGGGIYEEDAFYDICDELGILVWQDFMFACSYYPDTPEFLEQIRKEAENQICRLRHHPCIALWCGNNECHQVWQDEWGGKDKQPPRFHGEAIYHEVLRDAVARLDPGRAYWPGSPYGSGYCNSGIDGDQHFWDVWHGRGDWSFYKDSDARFCSEFGFASSPSRATWKRAGVDISVPKDHAIARAHNKTGKPFEVFTGLVELHYPQANTLDEWSYFSQLNQRDAMRAAIEHFRLSGRCQGALLWQLNDCWPVESWSVLEFDGRKKAVAFELKRLFAPFLLGIASEGDQIIVRACLHNTTADVSDQVRLRAIDLASNSVHAQVESEGKVEAGQICELIRGGAVADRPILWVAEMDSTTAHYVTGKPSGIRKADSVVRVEGGTIEFVATSTMVDVRLQDLEQPANSFEPNFFTILAGDRITIESTGQVGKLDIQCLDFGGSPA